MKILMLVNWKVEHCKYKPVDKQPPDFYIEGEDYWFYRYFNNKPQVDVVDISSFKWLESLEKNKFKFYIWQTLRILPKLKKYDLIVSHGMQSGVVLSLFRRFFKTKAKHIVFDIGSFASASEKGFSLKLMQFASKSIDGLIYHTSSQILYYRKHFQWLEGKSTFIRFGTDIDFFIPRRENIQNNQEQYIVCVGYSKRDWETLVRAYKNISTATKLRLIGHVEKKYENEVGIEQFPFVSIDALKDIISMARFAVLPLQNFNYSYGQMTLLQQMALEKCVIVADVLSLKDYVINNETALLYKPEDVEELQKKILKALGDDELVDNIGKNARKYLIDCCNEKIMAREIEKFYDKIIK